MNNAIWKKYDILLNVTIFLVTVLALIYFVVLPMKQAVFVSSDELKKKKIDNELDTERLSRIPEMDKTHLLISSKRDNLNVILNKDGGYDLIKRIESLAAETDNKIEIPSTGVKEVSLDEKNAVVGGGKKEEGEKLDELAMRHLLVEINLSGTYSQMVNFLNKLENMNYAVSVVSLDLKKELAVDETTEEEKASSNSDLFGSAPVVLQREEKPDTDILESKINIIVYLKD